MKQLQIAHLAKGKMFGDHNLENDFKIERRAGDNAECHEYEPYSIYTQNPAELFYIERLIFAQCIEPSDIHEYAKLKAELPNDKELRRKFIQAIQWAKFKQQNLPKGKHNAAKRE